MDAQNVLLLRSMVNLGMMVLVLAGGRSIPRRWLAPLFLLQLACALMIGLLGFVVGGRMLVLFGFMAIGWTILVTVHYQELRTKNNDSPHRFRSRRLR